MDVQSLDFPSACFDTVLTTCVFLLGTRSRLRAAGNSPSPETHRRAAHVRTCPLGQGGGLKQLMNLINPVAVRLSGAHINRQTKENLLKAGFSVEEETYGWMF